MKFLIYGIPYEAETLEGAIKNRLLEIYPDMTSFAKGSSVRIGDNLVERTYWVYISSKTIQTSIQYEG